MLVRASNTTQLTMSTQESKNRVLAWLPLMNELENMGIDPVKHLFSGKITIEKLESSYVAITKCKEKYPEWYSVMSEYARI